MSLRRNGQDPSGYIGVVPVEHPKNIIANRAPTTNDRRYKIGTLWIDKSGNAAYQLTSVVAASANWQILGSSGFMQWSDATLTSTEVKNLGDSPYELVEAPGEGAVIKFMGATLKLNYGGSDAFTESDDDLVINYTDGSGESVSDSIEMTGFIDQTEDTYTNAEPATDVIVAASGAENESLVLVNPNDEISGNASDDNTLTVRVYYTVQIL